MGASIIAGFCERCGRRHDLERPRPGERRLGLERIRAAFRYCVRCRGFVGRSCCWNPEAVACIVCAPRSAFLPDQPAAPGVPALPGPDVVQPALDEMRSAVTALGTLARELTAPAERFSSPIIDQRDWEEAWTASGWLLARADSCRDAVSRQLWDATAAIPDDGINVAFRDLLSDYELLVHTVERRLHRAGRVAAADLELAPTPAPPVAPQRPRRRAMRLAWPVAAAGLLLVSAAAAFSVLGTDRLRTLVGLAGPSPTLSGEGVLGGNPSPAHTIGATPSASQAPVAMQVEFDDFRIGAVEPTPGAVASVAGSPEVVAFPSPFNRSLRLAGADASSLCVEVHGLHADPAQVVMDLYRETVATDGSLSLTLSPHDGTASSFDLPGWFVESLPAERWVTLTASWDGATTVGIEAAAGGSGAALASIELPALPATTTAPGAVCIGRSAAGASPGVLVNVLQIDQ